MSTQMACCGKAGAEHTCRLPARHWCTRPPVCTGAMQPERKREGKGTQEAQAILRHHVTTNWHPTMHVNQQAMLPCKGTSLPSGQTRAATITHAQASVTPTSCARAP
jgi:hypothetical protein